uniref:Uncharacterized protein n=1 Tax=Oryza sativa subsp. japonica TaxID=39947 RepID=Q7EYL0_ORYSJ|nr:hypothetical protein [Oryza sativa Japonica Group]
MVISEQVVTSSRRSGASLPNPTSNGGEGERICKTIGDGLAQHRHLHQDMRSDQHEANEEPLHHTIMICIDEDFGQLGRNFDVGPKPYEIRLHKLSNKYSWVPKFLLDQRLGSSEYSTKGEESILEKKEEKHEAPAIYEESLQGQLNGAEINEGEN